eukprot:scaffold1315_cov23-Cyclotella_meneghiniana.AAC.9
MKHGYPLTLLIPFQSHENLGADRGVRQQWALEERRFKATIHSMMLPFRHQESISAHGSY